MEVEAEIVEQIFKGLGNDFEEILKFNRFF